MIKASAVKNYVEERFADFGINKKREISRLLYEIAKRDGIAVDQIISFDDKDVDFDQLRKNLIKKRFPSAASHKLDVKYSFPELDVDEDLAVEIDQLKLMPESFCIEEEVANSSFVKKLREKYPNASFSIIKNYAAHIENKNYSIKTYNNRLKNFYIIKENYDFFKRCACSKKSVHCGYHVVNLGSGCAFECEYCYLQDYINSPGIILPANLGDFFEEFKKYKQDINVGSGEITDSLIFDHITEYSPKIVDFFRNYPKSKFEFKTKSDNVDLLFTVEPSHNIVIAWSINPPAIIETIEHYTANLEKRLLAAKRCAKAGYSVAFHLDPIIYYPEWKKDYLALIGRLYDEIPHERIAWISVGTLRMTSRLKKIIENRFPDSFILNEEFFLSYDGKLRYAQIIREEIYRTIKDAIHAKNKDTYLYLCMEEKAMCESAQAAPIKPYRKD